MFSSKTDSPIKTTKSLEQGGFIFEGVLPGEYHIRASSHLYSFEKVGFLLNLLNLKLKILFDFQHSSSVIVKNSNTKCPHDLLVSGYNIQGKVTAQQQAVAGVHLLLFAKTKLTKEVRWQILLMRKIDIQSLLFFSWKLAANRSLKVQLLWNVLVFLSLFAAPLQVRSSCLKTSQLLNMVLYLFTKDFTLSKNFSSLLNLV